MAKDILYLQYTATESARRRFQGVQRYMAEHGGWNLNVVENCKEISSIRRVVKYWHPDGCIADCTGKRDVFRFDAFGGCPFVLLNRPAGELTGLAPSVYLNERKIALVAAKESLRIGRRSCAFVPYLTDTVWSNTRRNVFRKALNAHGLTPRTFCADTRRACRPKDVQSLLRRFLATMPLPATVFAANDSMARETISAARALGLSVPEDVAVIGVDNNELIATSTTPSLTTVEIDFQKAGYMAAQLLDERMATPQGKVHSVFLGPIRLVRRGSTAVTRRRDDIVANALEFIRRDCRKGITAADVAGLFPCSRRMAEIRFRTATGRSIGEEILSCRMDIVRSLLSNPNVRLDAIADLAGWRSPDVLRQYFRSATGMSMRDWRRQTGAGAP